MSIQLIAPAVAPAVAQSSNTYAFSVLEGDLKTAYPLTKRGDNFTVHYQPDTFAARNIHETARFIAQARAHITAMLGVRFNQPFDVYLAGAFFAPPDQALRGRAFSKDRRLFVLFDGSGSPAERRYMLAHELTHLIAWNTYGRPKSTLLSEGLAVYAAERFLVDTASDAFMQIDTFCQAYHRAGKLPLISPRQVDFPGHLMGLSVYYASGCFVKHLMQQYGASTFGALYGTVNYAGLYGKSLSALEQEWLATLNADRTRLPAAAMTLPEAYTQLMTDYANFFDRVAAGHVDLNEYQRLDRRRLDLLRVDGIGRSTPTGMARLAAPAKVAHCQRPPDDYTRVSINGQVINARTLWMLKRASTLYRGKGNPMRITQGSYVDTLAESFGTHAGGGAVDISVRVAGSSRVLTDREAQEMVKALRQAGFAAWLRKPADLKPTVPLHIHAIAIGDRELSDAAKRQLEGPEGYFRGLNGVPPENGGPSLDRHGGPLLCAWMEELGFRDLR